VKLKLDENVHVDVRRALAEQGYDVATVREEGLRGHPDVDVLTAAGEEARCLVTLDLDFANPIHYPPPQHHGVVVLRLRTPTYALQVKRLLSFFETQSEALAGKLWILDETRARDWTP
jgi:predicted nuclease of predicted toxin-antitoxin system